MIKFDGVVLKIGAEKRVVPALTLKQIKALRAQGHLAALAGIQGEPTDAQMASLLVVCHAALSRNYPDMTTDELEDDIDLNVLQSVVKAVVGQSGLEVVESGEAERGVLTGMNSTPA